MIFRFPRALFHGSLLALPLILSLTACSGDDVDDAETGDDAQEAETGEARLALRMSCYRVTSMGSGDAYGASFLFDLVSESCLSTPAGHGWYKVIEGEPPYPLYVAVPFTLPINSCYIPIYHSDQAGMAIVPVQLVPGITCESKPFPTSASVPACAPAPAIKYPAPMVNGYLVGAKGTPVSGGTVWPYSDPSETAGRFCRDRGLCGSTGYTSSIRSSAYSAVSSDGAGTWGVTGDSGVTMLDEIACAGLEGAYQQYSQPSVNGQRVGRSTTSSISRGETAKQFCISKGHAPAYSSFSVSSPTGTAYSYWTGSSWSITGNSSVELFHQITCASP